jgi:hypothetical protein
MSILEYLSNNKIIKTAICIFFSIFLFTTDIIDNKNYNLSSLQINNQNITTTDNILNICDKTIEEIYYYKFINLFFGIFILLLFVFYDMNINLVRNRFSIYGLIYLFITYICGLVPIINIELNNCNSVFRDIIPYQYYSFIVNYICYLVVGLFLLTESIICKRILHFNCKFNNNELPSYTSIIDTQPLQSTHQISIDRVDDNDEELPKYEQIV